jgi:hypothetical protein
LLLKRQSKQLPSSASRTYIHTGNALNVLLKPDVLTFGMAKSSAAHMIGSASLAYSKQGFKWVVSNWLLKHLGSVLIACRFYYADERQADGGPTIPVNGPAAGDMYVELAEKPEQEPWDFTFMAGKGYIKFKHEQWVKRAVDV